MRLLIVDDDPTFRQHLVKAFADGDYQVSEAATLSDAVKAMTKIPPDFVILDANFPTHLVGDEPEFNAGRLLDEADKLKPRPLTILVSGENKTVKRFSEVSNWLETERIADIVPKNLGAYEFLTSVLVLRVDTLRRAAASNVISAAADTWPLADGKALSSDPQMVEIAAALRRVLTRTGNDCPILLTGETGSGKTFLAKELIYEEMKAHSDSKTLPWKDINCARLDANLAESTIFGHVKGAFTGACQRQPGAVDDVEEGLLFLDEVHFLSLEVQGKLLKFLEARKYSPMGSEAAEPETFGGRVVIATDSNVDSLIALGKMSEQFYNRICGATFHVPSLRERPADIEHFARRFLADRGEKSPREGAPKKLSVGVVAAFRNYAWPGNMRQLAQIISSIYIHLDGDIVTPQKLRGLQLKYRTHRIEWDMSTTGDPPPGVGLSWPNTLSEIELKRELIERLGLKTQRVVGDLEAILRDQSAPASRHYFAVWLYLVALDGRRASTRDLMDAINRGNDYIGRITKFLAGVAHPDGTAGFGTPVIESGKAQCKLWFSAMR